MKNRTIFILAILACGTAAVLSLTTGAAGYSPGELLEAISDGTATTAGRIFYFARLPRTCACLLSGAALAVAGCVIQGVLANPLASPSIIGVNAGAGLAVTVCCALGVVSGWGIAGTAFAGALCAVALVVFCAEKTGASRTTVILGGVAVNTFLNGLRDAVTNLLPDAGLMSADFRVGDFSSVSVGRLLPAGALILLALGLVFTLHNELDVLTLGENAARGLGMNVRRIRTVLLALAALLSGASVSFAGLLSFVGLIIPHCVRKIAGSESRILLPLSALAGAAFVTLADLFARMVFAPYELPVGVFLSVLGGPFFLWLLYKRKGGRTDD